MSIIAIMKQMKILGVWSGDNKTPSHINDDKTRITLFCTFFYSNLVMLSYKKYFTI